MNDFALVRLGFSANREQVEAANAALDRIYDEYCRRREAWNAIASLEAENAGLRETIRAMSRARVEETYVDVLAIDRAIDRGE